MTALFRHSSNMSTMEPGVHSVSGLAARKVTVPTEMDGEPVDPPRCTTGNPSENSVGNNAVVRLKSEHKSVLCFTYHAQDRKRIFSLSVENTMTTKEVKEALAREMSKSYRPIDMTDKTVGISEKWTVLPDDSYPALGGDNEYTVHVLPRNESWVTHYVNYSGNSSSDLEGKKFIVFVPEQSAADRVREEIAKMASCAPECLEVKLSSSKEKDEADQSDDDIDDSGVDSDEEDDEVELLWRYVKDKAKIPKRAGAEHNCCSVRARASSITEVTVQVFSDVSSEVTELIVEAYEHNTMDVVLQRVAEKMEEDSKRVRLFHMNKMVQPEKALRDYSLHGGASFTASIFTRGAVINVHHSQGVFKYPLFVVDTALVTSAQLKHFIESKHKFCQNSINLYHESEGLAAESSLQDMGIGMNATLVVYTKNPETTPDNCKTQRRSEVRIFELDSEIPSKSCSVAQHFQSSVKTPVRKGRREASSEERHESRGPTLKSKRSQRKKQKAEGFSPDQLDGDGKSVATHTRQHTEKLYHIEKEAAGENEAAGNIPRRRSSSPKQLPTAKGKEQSPQCIRVQQTPPRRKEDLLVYENNHQGSAHQSKGQPNGSEAQDPPASDRELMDRMQQIGKVKKRDQDSSYVDEASAVYKHDHDDDDNIDDADAQEGRGDVGRGERKPCPQMHSTPYNSLTCWLEGTPKRTYAQQRDEVDSDNIERTVETKTIQKGKRTVARTLTITEIDTAFANDLSVSSKLGHSIPAIQSEASPTPSVLKEPPGVIKDTMLREIAERLGHDWSSLCLGLGVSADEITCIQHDNTSLNDRAFEGLRRWRKCKGREATPAALKEALQKKELHLLAYMIPDEEANMSKEN